MLNEYARVNDPFARIGKESVTVQITSVTRASDRLSTCAGRNALRQRCAGPHRTLERGGVHRAADAAHRAARAQEPLGIYVNGCRGAANWKETKGSKTMNDLFRISVLPVILLAFLSGCATQGKPPPSISLDEPVQAQPLPEPPAPVEVVAMPQVLPMPAQMKPVPDAKPAAEPPMKPCACPAPMPKRALRRRARATSTQSRCGPSRTARYIRSMRPWAA